MNNRHLKVFITVYECMSMTRAAEILFITQPSVSQAIKEIESTYNTKLFDRYSRKLFPTPEGDLLYSYAKQIAGLYEKIEEELQFLSNVVTIKVGANISVGTALIGKYINAFKERYPDSRVEVKVAGSSKLRNMIMDHEIDFALMEDMVYDTNLVQKPFYKDRIVLVSSPRNPLAKRRRLKLSELGECDFLLRERGVGVRDKFDYIMKLNNIYIEPVWESSNTRALINAAKEDYGIAVLPYLLVKDDIEKGDVAELEIHDKLLNRNLNVVYHGDKIFNRWTNEFIDIVKEIEGVS
jgi:LysR family transcriptional regulator, transcriptional activator of the cysJI operon